jgi:hypothetical protein
MEGDKSGFLEGLGEVVRAKVLDAVVEAMSATYFGGGWRIGGSVEFWNEEEWLLIVGWVACG